MASAADQYPNHISKTAHDSKVARTNVAPEWPENKAGDLKALHPDWYADNGDTQQKANNR